MATRLFLAGACSGIGFLVYVLTGFVRESRRGKGNHHRRPSSELRRIRAGRLVLVTPADLNSRRSFDGPKSQGRTTTLRRIGTLGLLAGISVCPKFASGQSMDAAHPSHEGQKPQVKSATGQSPENGGPSRQGGASAQSATLPLAPQWSYGGFIDAAYLLDFNHPANDLFRSRGTAYKVDEPILNMAAAYLRKASSDSSRWGMEFTLQGGQDSRIFGFSATAPNLPGSRWLRHLGPTDVSYLVPTGKGLTVQAGIFSSFIGYDSLYAKDNFNYTRPWGADFTPYLMMGVNASYPLSNKLTETVFLVNGYWHLADANHAPSAGSQVAYKVTDHTTLKETVLFGPHQSDTGVEFWRFLWDSIAEWRTDRVTTAFEYHIGTEKIAAQGDLRALWMFTQLPVHWVFSKNWSATVRPEVYWDRDGRLTGFPQTVKANTTTLEYRVPYRQAAAIVRLEHRIDDSRGPGGGFFRGGEVVPGLVGLTPTQNLLIVAVILTFDSHFQP
jgi:Putative beta-barrel porin-2, OmpL-like. bbp2